jgi:hypothetical protein
VAIAKERLMPRARTRIRIITIAFAVLVIAGFAAAQGGDPAAAVREQLAKTEQELESARTTSSVLTSYLEEGRIYGVAGAFAIDQPVPWVFVTRDEGILAVTLSYLMHIAKDDRPFDAQVLARWISDYFSQSRDLREYLEALDQRMDVLRRRRAQLENTLAEFEGAPGSGPCLELVRVDRQDAAGSVLASIAQLGAATSNVHANASAAETGRGYPGDFTLRWTSPPARICVGEPFQMTATATNHQPIPDGRLGRAAQVSYVFDPPLSVGVSCTNPPGFEPVTAAFVGDANGHRTNTCTITLAYLPRFEGARAFIHLSIEALGSGSAVFHYVYR